MPRSTRNSTGRTRNSDDPKDDSSNESDWTDLGTNGNSEDNSQEPVTSQSAVPERVRQPQSVWDDDDASDAIMHLVYYSVAMFTLPFVAYFSFKYIICQGYWEEPSSECLVPSAIAAIIVVLIIVMSFIRDAINDDPNRYRIEMLDGRLKDD